MERTIRINSIQQVSVEPETGSVYIRQRNGIGTDTYILEFADDEFRFDLMQSLAAAGKWHIENKKARSLTPDDVCGGGDFPPLARI
jgi:hypothetical protein